MNEPRTLEELVRAVSVAEGSVQSAKLRKKDAEAELNRVECELRNAEIALANHLRRSLPGVVNELFRNGPIGSPSSPVSR